ncbi:MAG: alpha-L-fucosidase [Acidobacteria bacterium]|nr:alpha-L-fucosidase [Acidobacteriota bacterium]
MNKKKITLILLILTLFTSASAKQYRDTWKSLDTRPIPKWFENAKFGIFVHWGVYSVPAWRKLEPGRYASYAEWYYARVMYNKKNGGRQFHVKNYGANFEYRDFAPMFRAELFNPEFFAKLFKQSGAKYVVLTAKHHDGFCLWPTKCRYKKNWNAMDTGPKQDLVGELTRAVKAAGLKMGFYYSIIEWESTRTHRTPSGYFLPADIIKKYKIPDNEYVNKVEIPQLKELVVNYKPSLLFADGGEWDGSAAHWKTKEFLAWLYNDSPVKDEIVVNDRFCKGMPGKHGDYFSSEYNDMKKSKKFHPWEESRGIGGSYGFNRAENLENYSTSAQLVHELIDIVSRGGNLLLNVGPTADGRIPVIMQERLTDIGAWLKVNGEAIYNSRRRSITAEKTGNQKVYFTTQKGTLYCIFTKWCRHIVIHLTETEKISRISLLGYSGKINFKRLDGNCLDMEIPCLNINEVPCRFAWTLKIKFGK